MEHDLNNELMPSQNALDTKSNRTERNKTSEERKASKQARNEIDDI